MKTIYRMKSHEIAWEEYLYHLTTQRRYVDVVEAEHAFRLQSGHEGSIKDERVGGRVFVGHVICRDVHSPQYSIGI